MGNGSGCRNHSAGVGELRKGKALAASMKFSPHNTCHRRESCAGALCALTSSLRRDIPSRGARGLDQCLGRQGRGRPAIVSLAAVAAPFAGSADAESFVDPVGQDADEQGKHMSREAAGKAPGAHLVAHNAHKSKRHRGPHRVVDAGADARDLLLPVQQARGGPGAAQKVREDTDASAFTFQLTMVVEPELDGLSTQLSLAWGPTAVQLERRVHNPILWNA
mmetsp:Transcript_120010/g.344986  ORF Transcript_120010/g.344986 Transcript_120010/m.344986 type:complete len:221 (-) Transcript_120010:121-783(-)